MNNCMVCERIELTKNGDNPYFVFPWELRRITEQSDFFFSF